VGWLTRDQAQLVVGRARRIGASLVAPEVCSILLSDCWESVLRRVVPFVCGVLGVGPSLLGGPLVACLAFQGSDHMRARVLTSLLGVAMPELNLPSGGFSGSWSSQTFKLGFDAFFQHFFPPGVAPPRIHSLFGRRVRKTVWD